MNRVGYCSVQVIADVIFSEHVKVSGLTQLGIIRGFIDMLSKFVESESTLEWNKGLLSLWGCQIGDKIIIASISEFLKDVEWKIAWVYISLNGDGSPWLPIFEYAMKMLEGSILMDNEITRFFQTLFLFNIAKGDKVGNEKLVAAIVFLSQIQKQNHLLRVHLFSVLLGCLEMWSLSNCQLVKEENSIPAISCQLNLYQTAGRYGVEASGPPISNNESRGNKLIVLFYESDVAPEIGIRQAACECFVFVALTYWLSLSKENPASFENLKSTKFRPWLPTFKLTERDSKHYFTSIDKLDEKRMFPVYLLKVENSLSLQAANISSHEKEVNDTMDEFSEYQFSEINLLLSCCNKMERSNNLDWFKDSISPWLVEWRTDDLNLSLGDVEMIRSSNLSYNSALKAQLIFIILSELRQNSKRQFMTIVEKPEEKLQRRALQWKRQQTTQWLIAWECNHQDEVS